jgi:hypothetical protein
MLWTFNPDVNGGIAAMKEVRMLEVNAVDDVYEKLYPMAARLLMKGRM